MEKYFDNKPSFLGSEVGLVLKTITVPANNSNVVTENNRKVQREKNYFFTNIFFVSEIYEIQKQGGNGGEEKE